MKKSAFLGAVFAILFPAFACADSAQGTITAIDQSTGSITLDDGNSYQLPSEFDYSALHDGLRILVFYDTQGGKRYISDMEGVDGPLQTPEDDTPLPQDGEEIINQGGGQTTNESNADDTGIDGDRTSGPLPGVSTKF